jgi:hypothetical protein
MITIQQTLAVDVQIKETITFTDKASLILAVKEMVKNKLSGVDEMVNVPIEDTRCVDSRGNSKRTRRTRVEEINEAEKKDIYEAYKDFEIMVRDIVEMFNLSCSVLYKVLEEFGSPRRIRKNLLVPMKDINTIKRLSSNGSSILKILGYYPQYKDRDVKSIINYNLETEKENIDAQ